MKKNFKWLTNSLCGALMVLMLVPMASAEEAGAVEEATPPDAAVSQVEPMPMEEPGIPAQQDIIIESTQMGPGNRMIIRKEIKGAKAKAELTEEQQQALTKAQADYQAAEDALIDEMVAAQALTQEVVDAYRAQQAGRELVTKMDYSEWTLSQISELRKAMRKTGEERSAALDALVGQSPLTQSEADAFKAAYAETINLWQEINPDTTTKGMIDKLIEVRQAYADALAEAGISTGGIGRGIQKNIKSDLQMGGMQNGMRGKGEMGWNIGKSSRK